MLARPRDAVAVGEPAYDDAAEPKLIMSSEYGREASARAELRLHGQQRHHHRPHADAAHRSQHDGDRQPQLGSAAVDVGGAGWNG